LNSAYAEQIKGILNERAGHSKFAFHKGKPWPKMVRTTFALSPIEKYFKKASFTSYGRQSKTPLFAAFKAGGETLAFRAGKSAPFHF